MKYQFTPVVYASLKTIEIDANSKEEALDIAMDKFDPPSLCWQCSDSVELGDEPIWELRYMEEVKV